MVLLRSLPETATYIDIFKSYPGLMGHLLEFEQTLLRGPSSFREAERELIAAYVSGLNQCS